MSTIATVHRHPSLVSRSIIFGMLLLLLFADIADSSFIARFSSSRSTSMFTRRRVGKRKRRIPFVFYSNDIGCSMIDYNGAFVLRSSSFANDDVDHNNSNNTSSMLPLMNEILCDIEKDPSCEVDENDAWEASIGMSSSPSGVVSSSSVQQQQQPIVVDNNNPLLSITPLQNEYDRLWEKVSLEATTALVKDPASGPQLYQGILSQPSLLESIVTVISHEIATELIPATELKILFLDNFVPEDHGLVVADLVAAATRCASVEGNMAAVLFQQGFHALVCHRLAHRLWNANRTGLAYYLQSTVSRRYSADIHPAARLGHGIHLRSAAGVVIGETAVVGNDTTILQGVTLGGTGKEAGDRHPKVGCGVTIMNSCSVLGNIQVKDGSILLAKSIVTKPVPPLAIIAGVPGRIQSYRNLSGESKEDWNRLEFMDDWHQKHLIKYMDRWKELERERLVQEEEQAKKKREKSMQEEETKKNNNKPMAAAEEEQPKRQQIKKTDTEAYNI